MNGNSLNFTKGCVLSCLSIFGDTKKNHRAILNYKALKPLLKVFIAVHTVAMANY